MTRGSYHKRKILRAEFGSPNKIMEEAEEFMDAQEQGCEVMAIVELADLIGAIKGFIKKAHPSLTLSDLEKMADVTAAAFRREND
jgi:phosphoribosyl-ATP pyrophosphohydrolase